jgi:hypothetical protein
MSASSGHGSDLGFLGWLGLVLAILYVLGVAVAASYGMHPWVFILGTLGAIGVAWLGWHVGHVLSHWFGKFWTYALPVFIGAWAAYVLFAPVWDWRMALTRDERWVFLPFGGIGILFLAYEVGHWFHHHRGLQVAVGLGSIALLIGLYLGRPAGTALGFVPPPASAPAGSPVARQAPAQAATASAASPHRVPVTRLRIECGRLSPVAAQAAGCGRR